MSYLCYLCVFANSGVQHISCYVFDLFSPSFVPYVASFSVLSFFHCPLLFSNVYLSYLL